MAINGKRRNLLFFLPHPCCFSSDLAREKNLKAQKGKNQASSDMEGNKGLSLQERQSRDAAK